MRNVDDDYIALSRRSTRFATARVTMSGEATSASIGPSAIASLKISRSVNGGKYCIGGTEAATMVLKAFTSELPSSVDSLTFKVEMGFVDDGGLAHYAAFGMFATNSENVVKDGLWTTITGYDAFYWMDDSGMEWPAADGSEQVSPMDMAKRILSETSVEVDYSGLSTLPMNVFRPTGSMREQIGQVAAASCANAFFDGDGILRFRHPTRTDVSLGPGDYEVGGFSTTTETALPVRKVKASFTKTYDHDSSNDYDRKDDEEVVAEFPEGAAGLSIELSKDLFAGGKFNCSTADGRAMMDAAESDLSSISSWGLSHGGLGLSVKGFSASLFGCPFIEPLDMITVTDHDGASHAVVVMSASWEYGGGIKTSASASASSEDSAASASASSIANIASSVDSVQGSVLALEKLTVNTIKGDNATFNKLVSDEIVAKSATITDLFARKVDVDFLNAGVAWLDKGVIRDGAIGSAAIHDGAITTAKIADATITAAKISDINADSITAGHIRTEYLILTDSDGDTLSIVSGLNAKAQSGEGGVLDGAIVSDGSISAAKVTVADLNAFNASIGAFDIGDKSIHSKKLAVDDPTAGIYLGVDGIGAGDGELIGCGLGDTASFSDDHGFVVDDEVSSYGDEGGMSISPDVSAAEGNAIGIFGKRGSPLEIYADGTFRLRGKNGHVEFDGPTGDASAEFRTLNVTSTATVAGERIALAKEHEELAAAVEKSIESLTEQIDGKVDTWFYEAEPSMDNEPASSWSEADCEKHVGDLYFDVEAGKSYRFAFDGSYSWKRIEDADADLALKNAALAQDTADHKRRVFTAVPYPPYDAGDLWVDGVDIRVCGFFRTEGEYDPSDWSLASKYATLGTVQSEISKSAEEVRLSVKSDVDNAYAAIEKSREDAKESLKEAIGRIDDDSKAAATVVSESYKYALSNDCNTPPTGSYVDGVSCILDSTWSFNASSIVNDGASWSDDGSAVASDGGWLLSVPDDVGESKYIWTACSVLYADGSMKRGYSVTPARDIVQRVSDIDVTLGGITARVQTIENGYVTEGAVQEITANAIKSLVVDIDGNKSNVEQTGSGFTINLDKVRGIKSSKVEYIASSDGVNAPWREDGWSGEIPEVPQGWYLWCCTTIEYTDGTSTQSFSVARIGEDGQDGKDGADGVDGKDGADGYSPTATVDREGSKVTITITDKDGTHTQVVNDGTDGTPGEPGADGISTYVHVKYSNDGGNTFTGDDGEAAGAYIGICTDTSKEDPLTVESYTWSRIRGTNGVSLSSVVTLYYLNTKTDGKPSSPTRAVVSADSADTWTSIIPTWRTGAKAYYTCMRLTYTNGAISHSPVVMDSVMTSAAQVNPTSAKAATNYIKFDYVNGLVVGNLTEDTLLGNVQITAQPSIALRNGTMKMAEFTSHGMDLYSSVLSSATGDAVTYNTTSFGRYGMTINVLNDDGSIKPIGSVMSGYLVDDPTKKGLSYFLDPEGDYIDWSVKKADSDNGYRPIMTYTNVAMESSTHTYEAKALHLFSNLVMNGYDLKMANIKLSCTVEGGATIRDDSGNPVDLYVDASNGKRYAIRVKNGFVIASSYWG